MMNEVNHARVTSPLIKNGEVRLITQIKSSDIIKLYANQVGVSVSDLFKNVETVSIYECIGTGYRFYYPFSLAGDGVFYSDIQSHFKKDNVDYYRDWGYDHDFASKIIKRNSLLLEVGCGTGKFMDKLEIEGVQFTGLELNQQAVEIAVKKGYDVINELVELHAQKNYERYDTVCAFQVLEHIPDPASFIESCLQCLRKGGELIIGVPNNEPYFQRHNKFETFNLPPHHMGLWKLDVFRKLESLFPVKLDKFTFDPVNERVLVDAYLRSKRWSNVKSLPRQHSLFDKIKMIALAPITVTYSMINRISTGINGGYVAVSFIKL